MLFYKTPTNDIFDLENHLHILDTTGKSPDEKQAFDSLLKSLEASLYHLELHKDPHVFLPAHTKWRFLKVAFLRLLKVYSSVQVAFNQILIEHAVKVDSMLELLTEKVMQLNDEKYTSLYFNQDRDLLQKFLFPEEDGKEEQKKYKIYSQYLCNVVDPKLSSVFVDIGFGKGQFFEVLKEIGAKKIIGLELNEKFCEEAKKAGYETHFTPPLAFLQTFRKKLSGISMLSEGQNMSFSELYDLAVVSLRTLEDGGVFILEKLPEVALPFSVADEDQVLSYETMQKILQFIGFSKVEVLILNGTKKTKSTKGDLSSQEKCALIAYK